MTAALLILLFVSFQRLGELVLARHNTQKLLAMGAKETDAGHYPLIVLLHAAWLASLWVYGRDAQLNIWWLSLFFILQALRLWVLASLGPRWTTRIIHLPGAPLVKTGPYRWFRHPNYLVVIGEIAVLPLALHLPILAIAFSILNGLVLAVRIRAEENVLRP